MILTLQQSPGEYIVPIYKALAQHPVWLSSGGANFVFYQPHPGFAVSVLLQASPCTHLAGLTAHPPCDTVIPLQQLGHIIMLVLEAVPLHAAVVADSGTDWHGLGPPHPETRSSSTSRAHTNTPNARAAPPLRRTRSFCV